MARYHARMIWWLSGLLLLLANIGCDRAGSANGAADALLVSTAASVAPALREIAALYEERTGRVVHLNVGSSGPLAQQIEQGAPVDLFVSANTGFVDELERAGLLLPNTRALYARGELVLWTPADSPLRIERLEDLTDPRVRRIAIANPEHAPYGTAARQALRAAGVWAAIQPKLVIGGDVRQTFQYAATGNVDVALVARSLTQQETGHVVPVPQALHHPLDQALAVVRNTRYPREARGFATFLVGPEGRAILARYGFAAPGEERRE